MYFEGYFRGGIVMLTLLAFLVLPTLAHAQLNPLGAGCAGVLKLKCDFDKDNPAGPINDFILSVLNVILYLVGIVALIALIAGGVMYIAALGEEDKIRTAKRIIIFSVVGLIIVGLSWSILNFVLGAILPAAPPPKNP